VFLGTASFGLPTLEAIQSHRSSVLVGVVTGPDKAQGRGLSKRPTPVAAWAEEHRITPLLKPARLRAPETAERLCQLAADIFVVVAYRILPEAIFTIPRYAFNLHASRLPAYRGAAPIQRALMAGETETGLTTFLLEQSVDTGGVLGQCGVAIAPGDDTDTLAQRMAEAGARLVIETLDRLERGEDDTVGQDEAAASAAPKITQADRPLDFRRTAEVLVNQVRGLAPRPGGLAHYGAKQIKILALELSDRTSSGCAPGEIMEADPRRGLLVAAADFGVWLRDIQPSGKKLQTGAEFVRGYRVAAGEIFSPTASQ
jgi:methionyl-tRNA formyltransferase